MPLVIMPLTVEPSKPRLCHDDRYIDFWIRDSPFHLETLKDVHRIIDEHAFMVKFYVKSGYDHINLLS